MNIHELIQKLTPDAEIELFELDLSPITGSALSYYFHSGTKTDNTAVSWQGRKYEPYPMEADGWEMNTKGSLPRPTLRVANISGLVTALLNDYDDMVGARIVRRRTYARYLDGAAEADPNAHLPDDIFFIERKIAENPVFVEFELASAMDLEGVMLPGRSVIADYCPWIYKGPECSYAGELMFDVNNIITTDPTKDVCSKTSNGCKLRFGATAVLPFGGFPASRAYKL